MPDTPSRFAVDRRDFLTTASGALLGAALPPSAKASEVNVGGKIESVARPMRSGSLRKIPIGVFDPVYEHLSLDAKLEKVSALGLEAMEIGTGGYPNNKHCALDEFISDKS